MASPTFDGSFCKLGCLFIWVKFKVEEGREVEEEKEEDAYIWLLLRCSCLCAIIATAVVVVMVFGLDFAA